MFNHIMIGSNDIDRSKAFYDAIFVAIGATPGVRDPKGRLVYAHDGGKLIVTRPIDGKPATHANGGTIGISAGSPERVNAWHAAGISNGGTACEDPPGIRGGGAYVAYLRDPDGNKLCAVHRAPA